LAICWICLRKAESGNPFENADALKSNKIQAAKKHFFIPANNAIIWYEV